MNLALVTLEDRRAVYALLDRMLDWLPQAGASVQRDPSSKPGAGAWRRCGRCAGTGRVTGEGAAAKPCRLTHLAGFPGHTCRPCLNCEHGWLKAARGSEGSDRMLTEGKHELHDLAQAKAERRRWLDAQILNLQAMQRVREGGEALPDQVMRAMARKAALYSTGSFRELELALVLLQAMFPLRYEAARLFVIDQHAEPIAVVRVHLDETVDWLAARMPRPVRLPRDADEQMAKWKHTLEHGRTAAHRLQRDARNAEIRLLRDAHGWSVARLASKYALSRQAVYAIVADDVPVASVGAA